MKKTTQYLAVSVASIAMIATGYAQTDELKDAPNLEEIEAFSKALQLEETANEAQDMAFLFKVFAQEFNEDIVGARAPFDRSPGSEPPWMWEIHLIEGPPFSGPDR